MKMNYIKPETDTRRTSVDLNFLATQQSEASGPNISFENESDFDSYFNN